MKINKTTSISFSPNGTSREIIKYISEGMDKYRVEPVDLTMAKARNKVREFKENDLLLICLPVYTDRLPIISDEIFSRVKGHKTPALIMVSYGNRDYGDALLELKDKLESRGFKIIAAGAAVGQHCLNTSIAPSRPDQADRAKLKDFGKQVQDKIEGIENIKDLGQTKVKGKFPYKKISPSQTPMGDDTCIQCGICAKTCPVDAIDLQDFRKTDKESCIFCGKCIEICPENSRDIKDLSFIKAMDNLKLITKERKELEIFI